MRLMFEAPYEGLKTEDQRVKFLKDKLERHHNVRAADLAALTAGCN
jgi:hypothetical protein